MAPRPMSEKHEAALAKGRSEARAVREYLEGLRSIKPKRGRKRTVESISARLERIDAELRDASAVGELQLVQERRDLVSEIEAMRETVDIGALEAAFVEVAASFSAAQGISYASWRDVGVAADVLKRAGVTRTGSGLRG